MKAAVPTAPQPDTILRLPDVLVRVGISRAVLYRLIGSGQFPPALKLSARLVGWRASDIDRWIASRENPTESARVTIGG